MKQHIIDLLTKAVEKYNTSQTVELTLAKEHGDFSSNIALKLSKELGKNPRDIAQEIVEQLNDSSIEKAEVAGPGFINIFVSNETHAENVQLIINEDEKFGQLNQGKYINIEYVSANPTGYLHLGHARGAVLGSVLANILTFAGNTVDQEYYINDAGNQMNVLLQSVKARLHGNEMPEVSYGGQEIIWVADEIKKMSWESMSDDELRDKAKDILLREIKADLEKFNVHMKYWSSEKEMYETKAIEKTLEKLKPHTFEEDGATWLKTVVEGDDKDRVLIKSDGTYTYLTPDIAYHDQKLSRGYDELINIWGEDHIGYIKRMEVALGYLGLPADKVDTLVLSLVKLIKDGQELKMSKRAGTSYWLRDLIDEAGVDATRFFMVDRANTSTVDFDINKANDKSSQNPVFTLQYTHARINSLLKKATVTIEPKQYNEKEINHINLLLRFRDTIEIISRTHKVHLLNQYLIDVSSSFNSIYSQGKFIGAENEGSLLALAKATMIILKNGLELIGVSTPEEM